MRPESTLFFDVDTQRDFIFPDGALAVPGAAEIVPTLKAASRLARERRILIVASNDRHYPGDPELQRNGGPYPDHCMNGTPGQRNIDETAPEHPLFVENRPLSEAELEAALAHRGEIIIEKQRLSHIEGNCNSDRLLRRLLPRLRDVVIYGVCTDICVDLAVRELLRYGPRLHVLTDAIAALDSARSTACLESWRKSGVDLLTFAELRARLSG